VNMSAHPSVRGPAAIFGSSFSACSADGTDSPKNAAQKIVSRMLTPIAMASSQFPRHAHAIRPTTPPHAAPSRSAVPTSRPNHPKYQARVG